MTEREAEPGALSWQQVRERLARAQEHTERALELSPEEAARVMDERARALAAEAAREVEHRELLEVLVLHLGDERYAIETRFVHEILPLADVTPLPGAPPQFLGLASVRGDVFPIVDPRRLLGLSAKAPTDLFRVVLLGGAEPELGLLAEATDEVLHLDRSDVRGHAPNQPGASALVRGITSTALVVLDGEALLNDERLVVDQGE